MTQLTQFKSQLKKDPTKYLIYVAIALLIVNFILLFLPFVEVYQPLTRKTTAWGDVTYQDWYTSSAPMISFIYPAFLTGIPYLCSIISLLRTLKKGNNKHGFIKIKNNAVDKPVRFFWLKFASIASLLSMWMVYASLQKSVKYLQEEGAWCKMTFLGVLNVLCTIAFVVVLFALSIQSNKMKKTPENDGGAKADEATQEMTEETQETQG